MKFTFEADMVRGQCYRCPLWQEDYDEDGGWAEYCKLDHEVDAYDEDSDDCPLKEANEVVWHPFPKERPNENGDYLVTIRWKIAKGETYLTVGNASWMGYGWDMLDTEILAWSELPEPYKETT